MIQINKSLTIKYKLSTSVFENLNKSAYATQTRSLGSSRKIVNTILSHYTFCDTILPLIIGNNNLNSDWEREKYEYISSLQISVPITGKKLNLNSVFDIENNKTIDNIKLYIKENNLVHKIVDPDDKTKTITKDYTEKEIATHILSNKLVDIIEYHKYFKFQSYEDYLYWVMCTNSAEVSNTTDDVNKSPNIRFFLYDEKVARSIDMNNAKNEILAIQKLDSINNGTNGEELLRSIAIINNVIPFDELEDMDKETIYLSLYQYCKVSASAFLTTAKDENIAIQAKIKSYINSNIFKIDASNNIVESANETNIIGKDNTSATLYFKNPTNKADIIKFEGQYKSFKNK